tara:strand:+ start:1321 stop:1476 length:156 start_codon:yes stop_codon:yes gene_type:complete
MKQIILLSLLSIGTSQELDQVDKYLQELEIILENASRNNQRVFVEDFTGLQ